MPVKYIKAVKPQNTVVRRRAKASGDFGAVWHSSWAIGRTYPILTTCCEKNNKCYNAYKLINNPLTDADQLNYEKWQLLDANLPCGRTMN